jgi:hypothetical protein
MATRISAQSSATAAESRRLPSSTGSQQIDLFGAASAVATPAWRELPEQVRGALINLLARLILEHARASQTDAGTEAGHDH